MSDIKPQPSRILRELTRTMTSIHFSVAWHNCLPQLFIGSISPALLRRRVLAAMPVIRPRNLRKGVSSKSLAASREINRAFLKKGMRYSPPSANDVKGSLMDTPGGLRALEDQIPFRSLCKMKTDAQAKKFLVKKHILKENSAGKVKCWVCRADMKASDATKKKKLEKQVIRCSNRKCPGHQPRLNQPSCCFTPLMGDASAGYEPNTLAFVLSAYNLGNKLQNDSAGHYARKPGDSLRKTMHIVDRYYAKLRVCLAYSEFKRGQDTVFSHEIVDQDSMAAAMKTSVLRTTAAVQKKPATVVQRKPATVVQRKPATSTVTTEYQGRLLTFKGRFTRKWCVVPLQDRKAA